MLSPAVLDDLMHRAWPARSTVPVDGWIAQLSAGVTQRANSVLPVASPRDVPGALDMVEDLYIEHGVAPTFQISPAPQPARLDTLLAERGYQRRSPTLVQVAKVKMALRQLPAMETRVEIDSGPSKDWMRLWWSVDGRGGPEEQDVARAILTACPARYALISDHLGVAAVCRLALVDTCGGIYCMAVRPDARRRGHATALLIALLEEASASHVTTVWLQVMENNQAARALYGRAGFITSSTYHYRSLASTPSRATTRDSRVQ